MSSMTRQHFIEIAGSLNGIKPAVNVRKNTKTFKMWRKAVMEMGRCCSKFNGNFDWNKFLTACGLDEEDRR